MPKKNMEARILEKDVLAACRQYLSAKGIFHFRVNNMGVYRGEGKYSFSGMRGISDLIAILEQDVIVDGHMEKFGCLLAIEVKRPKGKLSPEQDAFLKEVNSRGGLALCVHSLDELIKQLDPFL